MSFESIGQESRYHCGKLLVADPSLTGSYFEKSVIFLASHDQDGAFGFLLNQQTRKRVGDFIQDKEFHRLKNLPVSVGGPVGQDSLSFSLFWYSPETHQLEYQPQISPEEAIRQLDNPLVMVKAFLGYCGWSGGQLENELKNDSWFVTEAQQELFSLRHDKSLWEKVLSPLSPRHRLIAMCPEKPWLN